MIDHFETILPETLTFQSSRSSSVDADVWWQIAFISLDLLGSVNVGNGGE